MASLYAIPVPPLPHHSRGKRDFFVHPFTIVGGDDQEWGLATVPSLEWNRYQGPTPGQGPGGTRAKGEPFSDCPKTHWEKCDICYLGQL